MVLLDLLSATRVSVRLSVVLLAVFSLASLQAQPTAAQQTYYGFCSGRTSPAQVIYMSNVFSLPASARAGVRPAFLQYLKSQNSSTPVGSVNCTIMASQQQAVNGKQTSENMLQQQNQRLAATGQTVKLVETGWQYQAPSTPVTNTTTSTTTTRTTRRMVPASTAASTIAPANTPANTSTTVPANTPTNTSANGVSSIGQTVTDTGQNAKQGVTQSVQGIESSTTKTVTDSITSTTTAGQTAIQNKMKGWQDRMFHKAKPGQAATAPAQPSANTASTSAPGPSPVASVPASNLAAASATAPQAASKPTIQDEGDGKHSILSIPGQADARELTLVSGSKNVYIEDATGDKYIVMPNGEITHIPHKSAAK